MSTCLLSMLLLNVKTAIVLSFLFGYISQNFYCLSRFVCVGKDELVLLLLLIILYIIINNCLISFTYLWFRLLLVLVYLILIFGGLTFSVNFLGDYHFIFIKFVGNFFHLYRHCCRHCRMLWIHWNQCYYGHFLFHFICSYIPCLIFTKSFVVCSVPESAFHRMAYCKFNTFKSFYDESLSNNLKLSIWSSDTNLIRKHRCFWVYVWGFSKYLMHFKVKFHEIKIFFEYERNNEKF